MLRHWILWALCTSSAAHAGYETVVIDAGRGDVTLLIPEDHQTGAPLTATLWTIHGSGHVPAFSSGFSMHATAWMLRHSKAPANP